MNETPGKAASKWAKDHPDFIGILEVESTTRKGKGGWGETSRLNLFFVKNGRAVADRKQGGKCPGVCCVCSGVYLEPVLLSAYMSDPCAGQEVSEEDRARELYSTFMPHRYDGLRLVYGETARLFTACPSCLERPDVFPGYGKFTHLEKEPVIYRYHPLCDTYPNVARESIDMR